MKIPYWIKKIYWTFKRKVIWKIETRIKCLHDKNYRLFIKYDREYVKKVKHYEVIFYKCHKEGEIREWKRGKYKRIYFGMFGSIEDLICFTKEILEKEGIKYYTIRPLIQEVAESLESVAAEGLDQQISKYLLIELGKYYK